MIKQAMVLSKDTINPLSIMNIAPIVDDGFIHRHPYTALGVQRIPLNYGTIVGYMLYPLQVSLVTS
jgi:hypothetical protein